MKKTYNINIAGYGFVIDEDAYDMLHSYLSTLAEVCNRSDQRETAIDIEQRIAEIFSDKFDGSHPYIISLSDVEEVISRMGAPEEIVDVEVAQGAPSASSATPPPPPPFGATAPIEKRLYRDLDNRVLGGVCSGLGWYLGIDPVWIRIIFVVLAFISGTTLALIYIVLWIIVPAAKSPFERMQMMGVDPSMSNVGKVVTGGRINKPATSPGSARRIIVLVLSIIALLISGSLLLVLSLGFLGCVLALCITPAVEHSDQMAHAQLIMGCVAGGALVVGLPLFLLFRSLLDNLTATRATPLSAPQWLFISLFWLLGVAACIVCGILLSHLGIP